MVFLLTEHISFPDTALAEADGLLAIGGDLSPERLILAYQHGIFPWYSDGEPIMWHSPAERFVIMSDTIHISRSMQRFMRSGAYTITFDQSFEQVIRHCASVPRAGQHGTWITAGMIEAYIGLHRLGHAHSVEVWYDHHLIGGTYGIEINKVFCGESMCSLMPNASKWALIWLAHSGRYTMIDCQMHTPHLESMGGHFISRAEYQSILDSP